MDDISSFDNSIYDKNNSLEYNELNFKEIKKKLQKDLDAKRYEHSIGVADTAFCLALRFGENPMKAYLAGILHDCAKCIDDEKKILICKKNNIHLTKFEKNNPFLLHSKLGAFIAKSKYGIEDQDVLNAIMYHTTGREDMSLLEKIIFSADYIEPGRKKIPGLAEIREEIFMDIDSAIIMIYENTFNYLKNSNQDIDDGSIKAYEFYLNKYMDFL